MTPRRFAFTEMILELPAGAVTGHALVIDGARIHAIVPHHELRADIPRVKLDGGRLAAGFVDLQVNGGGDILFNEDPTLAGLMTIAAAHRQFGTTALLPTLISDLPERSEAAIATVRAARARGIPGVVGLHLEGPHLSPARRGVHAERALRPLEDDNLNQLLDAAVGQLLLTLAPEAAGLPEIERLAAAGIHVFLGHTDCDYQTACAAFSAGAKGVTHLFNAMSQLGGRTPGLVGAALDNRASWCGIIADGHHVHWSNIRLAWRVLGRRLVLVTDAMPPVGGNVSSFMLHGQTIRVSEGRCMTEDGRLAGSALDMASAVRNCVEHVGLPVSEALALASASPADAIGLSDELGRIAVGLRADLILLDEKLFVRRCWLGGQEIPVTAGS